MRIILVSFAIWIGIAAAPCSVQCAGAPSSPDTAGASQGPEVFLDASAVTLFEGERVEWASMYKKEVFRLVQTKEQEEPGDDLENLEEEEFQIPDPLEPVNRAFFYFNDKLYFWLLKPVATGYKWVFPELLRITIRNFFSNIEMPIRVVNCFLQGKFSSGFHEMTRFLINTTAGFAGLVDVANEIPEMPPLQDEDFGQTLGVWGLGHGIYLNWPVLGSSSIRDTVGIAGDYFLDPVNLFDDYATRIAIKAGDRVNETSLTIGDYEALKKAALDPYVAFRDAYHQFRRRKTRDRGPTEPNM